MEYLSHSEEETEALGARLAGALHGGSVVAYEGGLGMGKTAFTRGLARGLGQPHLHHRQRIRRPPAPVPL